MLFLRSVSQPSSHLDYELDYADLLLEFPSAPESRHMIHGSSWMFQQAFDKYILVYL